MSTEQKERQKEDVDTKPEKIWRGIFDETIQTMKIAEGSKAQAVRQCCTLLEQAGMPLDMICGRVVKELTKLDFVQPRWIYAVIDKRFKQHMKIHEPRPYTKKDTEKSTAHHAANIQKNDIEEETEIYQIKVQDYRIEDVEKYDRPFLQQLVIYLHNRIQKLQNDVRHKRE